MRRQEPTFLGLIALAMFLPILIPVWLLIVARKVFMGVFEWSLKS